MNSGMSSSLMPQLNTRDMTARYLPRVLSLISRPRKKDFSSFATASNPRRLFSVLSRSKDASCFGEGLAPAASDLAAGNGASGGGAASRRTTSPLRTTSRLNSPKLESPAADSGLGIYAEPRSTVLLLAVRTTANLETRHAHLQKTAHSRADEVFVRHKNPNSDH